MGTTKSKSVVNRTTSSSLEVLRELCSTFSDGLSHSHMHPTSVSVFMFHFLLLAIQPCCLLFFFR